MIWVLVISQAACFVYIWLLSEQVSRSDHNDELEQHSLRIQSLENKAGIQTPYSRARWLEDHLAGIQSSEDHASANPKYRDAVLRTRNALAELKGYW